MKNKVIKIITLVFIALMLVNIIPVINNECQAIESVTEDLDFWRPGEVTIPTNVENKVQNILGVISVIGIVTAVVTLAILGLKFMVGSVEEKAEYKKTLIPWMVGAILVASVSTLPLLISKVVEGFDESNGAVEQTQLSLNKSSVTLKMGEIDEVTLVATVTSSEERKIVWSSSNSKVARVDSNGKVTAVSEGTAIITVYTAGNQETCTVTVEAPRTTDIKLSQNSITLKVTPADKTTASYELTATVTPASSIEPVYWSSSNKDIATVDSNGKIKAVGKGEVTITATSGTKSDTCKVIVESERVYAQKFYNPTTNQVSDKRTSDKDLEFVLYIPDISYIKDIDNIPMIIHLHGGTKITASQIKSSNPLGLQNTDYGAICIFPISPYAEWKVGGWNMETEARKETLKSLIDYSIENYNVNKNKIALTGFSNGGGGTWQIGLKYPTLFSCLVPVCGYSAREPKKENGEDYPDCPVWTICSQADSSRGSSWGIRDLLNSVGGKVKADDRGYIEHADMLKEAYTPELINWMIERSRETNSSYNFD